MRTQIFFGGMVNYMAPEARPEKNVLINKAYMKKKIGQKCIELILLLCSTHLQLITTSADYLESDSGPID